MKLPSKATLVLLTSDSRFFVQSTSSLRSVVSLDLISTVVIFLSFTCNWVLDFLCFLMFYLQKKKRIFFMLFWNKVYVFLFIFCKFFCVFMGFLTKQKLS